MRKQRLNSEAGFTLIEMLISAAIMLTVTAGVFTLMNPSEGIYKAQPEASDMQQRMRIGVDTLSKDLVMAGAGTYVGAVAGVIMVMIVSVVTFDSLGYAALPPAIYVAFAIVEGQFLTPVILGRRLELNPVAIFICVAMWSWLWGIVGAIIAVPLLVAVKVLCDHFDGLTSFGEFLSKRPVATSAAMAVV